MNYSHKGGKIIKEDSDGQHIQRIRIGKDTQVKGKKPFMKQMKAYYDMNKMEKTCEIDSGLTKR